MGHGDVLIIADANFPSNSISKSTVSQSVLNMENLTAPEAIEAILSLLPLDTFVDVFAERMEVDGEPDYLPPMQEEIAKIVRANDDKSRDMISIERQAFYEFERLSYATVQTRKPDCLDVSCCAMVLFFHPDYCDE